MDGLKKFLEEHCLYWDKSIIKSQYLCLYCKQILDRPKLTTCGCHFCEKCIKTYLGKTARKCPSCEEKIRYDRDVENDNDLANQINKMKIPCFLKSCGKSYPLVSLVNHMKVCIKSNNNHIADSSTPSPPIKNKPNRKRQANGRPARGSKEMSYKEFRETLAPKDKSPDISDIDDYEEDDADTVITNLKKKLSTKEIPKVDSDLEPEKLTLEGMNKSFLRELFQLRCILESKYDKEIASLKSRLKESEDRYKSAVDKIDSIQCLLNRCQTSFHDDRKKCDDSSRKAFTEIDILKVKVNYIEQRLVEDEKTVFHNTSHKKPALKALPSTKPSSSSKQHKQEKQVKPIENMEQVVSQDSVSDRAAAVDQQILKKTNVITVRNGTTEDVNSELRIDKSFEILSAVSDLEEDKNCLSSEKPAGHPIQECLCSFTEMSKKKNGDTTIYYSEMFQICGYNMKVGVRYYSEGMIVVGLCLLRGEHDSELIWPIPYTFSLAVLDQAGIEFKMCNFGWKTSRFRNHYDRLHCSESCFLEESQIHVWDKSVTINDCVFIKCSLYPAL